MFIQCVKCNEYKPEERFGDRVEKLNGKRSWCLECNEKSSSDWRERNPERVKHNKRIQYLRKRDLLTRRVASQCEICGVVFDLKAGVGAKTPTAPHWDHNHETGNFRGWLCHYCNVLLGFSGDNPEILKKAVAYLESKGHAPTR